MGAHSATTDRPGVVSWLTPARRQWLYGVTCAAAALAAAWGLLDGDRLAAVTALAAAALGVATGHTGGTWTPPGGEDAG